MQAGSCITEYTYIYLLVDVDGEQAEAFFHEVARAYRMPILPFVLLSVFLLPILPLEASR